MSCLITSWSYCMCCFQNSNILQTGQKTNSYTLHSICYANVNCAGNCFHRQNLFIATSADLHHVHIDIHVILQRIIRKGWMEGWYVLLSLWLFPFLFIICSFKCCPPACINPLSVQPAAQAVAWKLRRRRLNKFNPPVCFNFIAIILVLFCSYFTRCTMSAPVHCDVLIVHSCWEQGWRQFTMLHTVTGHR